MKNKSFIGIDISKNVIDASIFCERTPIKDFPHDVFNNSRKGFGEMCTWLKKNHVVLSNCLFGMEFTGNYSIELEKFLNARKYQFCMLSTHVTGIRKSSDTRTPRNDLALNKRVELHCRI